MLQELYISPHFLTNTQWAELAEAISWARDHQQVLVDSHWIGGDPRQKQVYGWAAWRALQPTSTASDEVTTTFEVGATGGGIENDAASQIHDSNFAGYECTLTLRNPSDHSASISLNAATVFELPSYALGVDYTLVAAYPMQRLQRLVLPHNQSVTVIMAPYETLSFESSTQ